MGELRTYRGASYCLSAINEAQVSRDPATLTLTYLWDAQDSAQAPQQANSKVVAAQARIRPAEDPPPQAPQQDMHAQPVPDTYSRPAEDPIAWEAGEAPTYSVVHCHWTYLAPYGTAYAIADLERHVGDLIPITPGEDPVAVIAAFNLSQDCTQVTVTVSIPRNLIDQVHEMPPGAHFPPSFQL